MFSVSVMFSGCTPLDISYTSHKKERIPNPCMYARSECLSIVPKMIVIDANPNVIATEIEVHWFIIRHETCRNTP